MHPGGENGNVECEGKRKVICFSSNVLYELPFQADRLVISHSASVSLILALLWLFLMESDSPGPLKGLSNLDNSPGAPKLSGIGLGCLKLFFFSPPHEREKTLPKILLLQFQNISFFPCPFKIIFLKIEKENKTKLPVNEEHVMCL